MMFFCVAFVFAASPAWDPGISELQALSARSSVVHPGGGYIPGGGI